MTNSQKTIEPYIYRAWGSILLFMALQNTIIAEEILDENWSPIDTSVIIGINNYNQITGLRSLSYSTKDATAINNILKEDNYKTTFLINSDATKNFIIEAVESSTKLAAQNNGTFIFFYSGHGFSGEEKQNYLATHDTIINRVQSSALSIEKLTSIVQKNKVKNAIFFIDACRDNPQREGIKNFSHYSFIEHNARGLKILYSTEFGETSWESHKLQHGVFSYYLINALKGKAQQTKGKIPYESIKSYVQRNVSTWTYSNKKITQTPRDAGDNFGNPIIIKTPYLNKPRKHVEKKPLTPKKMVHHYVDNGNGIILDTKNRLMWKKCSEGQNNITCSGSAKLYQWETAQQLFSSYKFGGHSDWRIPKHSELKTLVECSNGITAQEALDFSCKGKNKNAKSYRKPTISTIFVDSTGSPSSIKAIYMSRSYNDIGVSFKRGNEVEVKLNEKMHVRLVRDY